jgi:hypothetical protein
MPNVILSGAIFLTGLNIISDKSLSEKAKMAEKAVGDECKRCVDYIKNIGTKLDELGIKDKAVQEILSFKHRGSQEALTLSTATFRTFPTKKTAKKTSKIVTIIS